MNLNQFLFRTLFFVLPLLTSGQSISINSKAQQFITVLGVAQDGGYPQAGCIEDFCMRHWRGEEKKRHVVSLGLTDHQSKQNWLFEATPDFTYQLQKLQEISGLTNLSGIFLTHAHMGHYAGLLNLGREAQGASGVVVYVLPKMKQFLENNAPWNQLVTLGNIKLVLIEPNKPIRLSASLQVTPMLVPHRDEFSETVGFSIQSSQRSALYIPDIDKWLLWDRDILSEVDRVDFALIDGTFYGANELPHRNMSEVPHPFVSESVELFSSSSSLLRNKILFIHMNHTNPILFNGPERNELIKLGFDVAEEGEIISLNNEL